MNELECLGAPLGILTTHQNTLFLTLLNTSGNRQTFLRISLIFEHAWESIPKPI